MGLIHLSQLLSCLLKQKCKWEIASLLGGRKVGGLIQEYIEFTVGNGREWESCNGGNFQHENNQFGRSLEFYLTQNHP